MLTASNYNELQTSKYIDKESQRLNIFDSNDFDSSLRVTLFPL